MFSHDRDPKFTKQVDREVRNAGIEVRKTAFGAPNTNAFVERFIQSVEQEALDHFVVVGAHRIDAYSLGVKVYELLTWQPAYSATPRADILRQVISETRRPPRKVRRDIPLELKAIVLKGIAKSPSDR